jgi:O-antigen/teichoic acid export membrane protein
MLRNAGFLLLTELISRLSALALAVAIARAAGSEGYGHYTYALAYATTFAAFADFGLSRLLARGIAADHAGAARLVSAALAARAVLLAPSLAIAVALTQWQPAADRQLLVLLLAVAATQSLAGLWRSVFYGFERMHYDTAGRLLERLLAVGGAFLALKLGKGLSGVALAFLVAGAVDVLVVTALAVARLVRPCRTVKLAAVGSLLRDAAPLGLYGLVLALQSGIPLYLLTALGGAASTGRYSAAATPVLALIPLPVLVAGSALPMLSRLTSETDAELREASSLLLRLFALAGLAAAPGLAIVAAPLIDLVYGPDFSASAPALRILAVGVLGIFPTQVCVNVLVARKRQSAILQGDVIALVWQLAVDMVAIPRWGIIGAALGTGSAELVLGGFLIIAVVRTVGAPNFGPLLRALPAVAGMAATAEAVLRTAGLAPAIAAGALGYGALLLVFRPLSRADIAEARRLFGR